MDLVRISDFTVVLTIFGGLFDLGAQKGGNSVRGIHCHMDILFGYRFAFEEV